MDQRNEKKGNRFERHPIRTLLLASLAIIFTLDFLAANMYTLIHGYPWSKRKGKQKEIMAREFEKIEKRYRIPSPIYHHDLAKNKRVSNAQYGNLRYTVCTDSLGFKDKAVRNIPLSSDNYRIIFIGDSFAEGVGFDYKDTFVGLIDAALSQDGIEVLNAALSSYSPTIYWRKIKYLIEDVGLRFNEVVVYLDLSDIEDEAIYYCVNEFGMVVGYNAREGIVKDSGGAEETEDKLAGAKKLFRNAEELIRQNSIVIYFAGHNFREMLKSKSAKKNNDSALSQEEIWNTKRSSWTIDKELFREHGQKGLEKAEFYMDRLHDLLDQHGIRLTVAVYPWPIQIYSGDLNSIQVTFWGDWCKKHDVRFIDYFPYFVTGKTKKEAEAVIAKYYIEKEYHWNKDGHRLVANVFLDFYKKAAQGQK